MFNALQGFLSDHRGLLVLVTIIAWLWFVWALKKHLTPPATAVAGPGQARMPTRGNLAANRKAGDIVPQQRTSTGGLAPAIEAGMAEHHVRSAAATAKLLVPPTEPKSKPTESLKTIKPPPPTPDQLKSADKVLPGARPTSAAGDRTVTEADAMEGLFSGLKGKRDETKTDSPTDNRGDSDTVDPKALRPGTSVIKRVNRLEEIGFHHQIPSDKLPAQSPPAPGQVDPPKPRTQSAELDDILKRIDKVLADSPTASSAPPSAPQSERLAVRPPSERLPAKPDAPAKLDPSDVLKRIDQALAESQGGAAEVTMMDPDWADEAERAATADVAKKPSTGAIPSTPPAPPAAAKPAEPAKPAAPKIPDWARSDIQDEDLDKKDDNDGKGGQQKLF